jgi:hypothetical protein
MAAYVLLSFSQALYLQPINHAPFEKRLPKWSSSKRISLMGKKYSQFVKVGPIFVEYIKNQSDWEARRQMERQDMTASKHSRILTCLTHEHFFGRR